MNLTELHITAFRSMRRTDTPFSISDLVDILSSITSNHMSRLHITFSGGDLLTDGSPGMWAPFLDAFGLNAALPHMDVLFARFAHMPQEGIHLRFPVYDGPPRSRLDSTSIQESISCLNTLISKKMPRSAARGILVCTM